MSLLRKFSQKISGRSFNKGDDNFTTSKKSRKMIENNPAPEPNTRQMTSANLFQPSQSTSTQSTAMDRTLYEIPQPTKVDAMTDLIKDHSTGELFPYVGVVGSEGESSDSRRARMLALKPSYNKRDVPEVKILGCPLISREGNFTMESLMSYAKQNTEPVKTGVPQPKGAHNQDFSITKPYVHIRQATILYTPNMSSTSNYCNFWMNLIDTRLIDSEKGSQTNVIVSNQEGILEMSCDYCVSTSDLASFTLTYTLERDIVQPGFQWGTASFYFSITESDLPYQSSKVDAMAVYRMPITTLMDRTTNADKSDISFTPADLVKLRLLYKQGDIVDVDHPQTARLKTNGYSKSSVRRAPKGEQIDTSNKPGWEFMNGARRPQIDAYEASVDPDSEGDFVPEHIVDEHAVNHSRTEALRKYNAKIAEEEMKMAGLRETLEGRDKEVLEKAGIASTVEEIEDDESDSFTRLFNEQKPRKTVRMSVSGV